MYTVACASAYLIVHNHENSPNSQLSIQSMCIQAYFLGECNNAYNVTNVYYSRE